MSLLSAPLRPCLFFSSDPRRNTGLDKRDGSAPALLPGEVRSEAQALWGFSEYRSPTGVLTLFPWARESLSFLGRKLSQWAKTVSSAQTVYEASLLATVCLLAPLPSQRRSVPHSSVLGAVWFAVTVSCVLCPPVCVHDCWRKAAPFVSVGSSSSRLDKEVSVSALTTGF